MTTNGEHVETVKPKRKRKCKRPEDRKTRQHTNKRQYQRVATVACLNINHYFYLKQLKNRIKRGQMKLNKSDVWLGADLDMPLQKWGNKRELYKTDDEQA